MNKETFSVGFLGAGMMATSIMEGLTRNGVVASPSQIWCSDPYLPTVESKQKSGYNASQSNTDVIQNAKDAIVLAVKPNAIIQVCKDIVSHAHNDQNANRNAVIISIAAGVSLQTLQTNLPGHRVIRVMPNTPCLVGEGAAAYALGNSCMGNDNNNNNNNPAQDRLIVETIFGSCGTCCEIQEPLLDAVTGLSGSGPAYVFQFIEALSDGGVRAGLPRAVATQLAAQTVKGAAEMVLQTGKHPGLLKDGVTSPGGTTIAGVEALENG